ncbi:MAG TPA: prolyl oligopeptidase family serine peptidase [Mycobacteriales bacterium]|nr:prolyl oligopeptidase family serine peptidase [Mycobacteriales bacterium]
MTSPYPFADRDELVEDLHGHRVADPYRWLEDKSDVRTIEWEAAQDMLVTPFLEKLPGREEHRTRLAELLRTGSVGVPDHRSPGAGAPQDTSRVFFTRRQPEQEHAVLLVREADGGERVLVDPMQIAPDGTATLDAWEPSIEGDRLAYQISLGGNEESHLHVIDVATGAVLDGPIDRCRYSPIAWLPGGNELYYVRRLAPDLVPAGEEQFHRRVYRHTVGAGTDTDVEIHGAGLDPTNYYGVQTSDDGHWLLVEAGQGTAPRSDVWIADLRAGGALQELMIGVDAQLRGTEFRGDTLYAQTDRDAPRGRVVAIDPTDFGYEKWRDAIPETDAVLAGFSCIEGGVLLAVHEKDATSRLSWWSGGKKLRDIELAPGSVTGVSSDPAGGTKAWIGYTDFTTPMGVLEVDLAEDGPPRVWENAPGRAQLPDLDVTETFCTSADGTQVHLFILRRADLADGPAPTVLYGYGGFGIALTPAYSSTQLRWVEEGGVWVIANLRGGLENGEEWHRAGMREHKQHVFDDFIAAAEHLIDAGVTTREQLGIYGGSNGGLLVGAALTQRPDLYRAVICSAPLLDMVRYEEFGLGRTWNDEFGTAADATELGWLLGYSPYHRVVDGTAYPSVLFTVFDSDTRVDPVHARKMCAALQHATTGDGLILLRRETDVGHGARSVSRTVGLAADQLAYFADRLGLD